MEKLLPDGHKASLNTLTPSPPAGSPSKDTTRLNPFLRQLSATLPNEDKQDMGETGIREEAKGKQESRDDNGNVLLDQRSNVLSDTKEGGVSKDISKGGEKEKTNVSDENNKDNEDKHDDNKDDDNKDDSTGPVIENNENLVVNSEQKQDQILSESVSGTTVVSATDNTNQKSDSVKGQLDIKPDASGDENKETGKSIQQPTKKAKKSWFGGKKK